MTSERVKKIAEAPARILEQITSVAHSGAKNIARRKSIQKAETFWKSLGPGLTTGAADDDPSGITTYSQTGARTGFSLLWLAPYTFPLMAIVQEMCARIGLVTGVGLAANIRMHFSRKVLRICTILLFAANTFNIGADLGAMATVTQLISPRLHFGALVIGFALLSLILQIFIPYKRYAKYLKLLTLILLTYILTAAFIDINWITVLRASIIPQLSFSSPEQIILITAILGTTISPYLFFWQTSQEVEEEIVRGKLDIRSRLGATRAEVNAMRTDVWSGMFFSNLVMFFIITVCSVTLYANGITSIDTAAQAAEALRPFAGNAAYILFAAGVIGTGLLAVPVLAGSASYAISESFAWDVGLYKKLKDAYAFYGVIIISMVFGLLLNFVGIDPIKALLYSAVANGVVAPVMLAIIVMLASNKKIMGEWTNKPTTTVVGWIITLLMSIASVATLFSIFAL